MSSIFFENVLMDSKRKDQDPLADKVFSALHKANYHALGDQDYNAYTQNGQKIPDSFPESLEVYFGTLQLEAAKIEPKILKQGSLFFERYAPQIMTVLGFLALPYCYAAADGAKVLYASERIKNYANKRLIETANFIFDIGAKGGFEPNGKGIIAIGKVRLMHAAIRFYISKQGGWDVSFGKPINQEDMAGTNLAFSFITLRGLRKLGYTISPDEANDYLMFWNAIGKLLGIQEDLLPQNLRLALQLDTAIKERHFKKSKEGVALTSALLKSIEQQDFPLPTEGLMYYLLGDEVAELLGLMKSDKNELLMKGIKNINAIQSTLFGAKPPYLNFTTRAFNKQLEQEKAIPYRMLKSLKD